MKKIVSILLVLVTVLSMGTMAFADGTTTLTTTVPAATYTLNIPADQTIAFGATSTNIGSIYVTNASGFSVGKNLSVSVVYSSFASESTNTTIPFTIHLASSKVGDGDKVTKYDVASGEKLVFLGTANNDVNKFHRLDPDTNSVAFRECDETYVNVRSSDWGKALGGDYTATITFTSEVVVE